MKKNKKSEKINKSRDLSQEPKSSKLKIWPTLLPALSIIMVVLSAVAVGYFSKFYYNWEHPIGDEVVALMGKMRFILNYFPHFNWNHEWDGGQPGFWIYLPFPFFIGALFVKFLNFTISHSITLLGLISYIFIAVGIYGITYRLSKNHLTAILAAILAITSQGIWYWDGAGYYTRTFGMGFYFMTLWTAIALVQKLEKQKDFFPIPKLEFLLTIIFFFLACYSHAFSNYLTVGSLIILFFIALKGWRKKMLATIFVVGAGIALSAFYYLLMLQANLQYYSDVLLHRTYEPHPLRLFWNLKPFEGYAGAPEVSPLILPLVGLLLIWFIVSKRRFQDFSKGEKRAFWILFIFLIVSLYYPLQGSLHLPKTFYIFMLPCDAPFLTSIFGAIFIGIVLGTVLRSLSKWIRPIVPIIILGLIGFMAAYGFLFPLEDKWPRRFMNQEEGFIERIKIDPESKQYRIGTTNPQWAERFNYFYDVPQNRDYFAQGVVYDNWQFWQQACIWSVECPLPDTEFLLDWFSIKWPLATASEVDTSYEKFSQNPELFDQVYQENPNFYQFEYKKATPILSATNTSPLLIVGTKEVAFDMILRDLAQGNINSQKIIPVKGKEYIDDYSLEELNNFSLVFLYEYKYHNRKKAFQLLDDYVKMGGGLIIEGTSSPEVIKKEFDLSFPDPWPLNRLDLDNRKDDWNFVSPQNQFKESIDFDKFDPPLYEKTEPWKVIIAPETYLKDNTQVILTTDKTSVVLAREHGQGRVVWMGMNLPFHIATFHNQEELKFLKNIMEWAANTDLEAISFVDYQAEFIHPERREITISSPALGVLNKEYYFPAWEAYLEYDDKKEELEIYRGGLDQQYIPLPADVKYPVKVVMEYGKYPIEIIGFIISGITFIILTIYLIYPPIISKIWKKTFGCIKFKTSSWWEKDEE